MSKRNLVVLTGAGVSAESGLKTFRDSGGLWEGYHVYEVASPQGWEDNPQLVLDFYNARRHDVQNAVPNKAHKGLALLEKDFNVIIITQNIDDLHERAGSSRVIHLHGEITKMRSCEDEQTLYPYSKDIRLGDLAEDDSQLRPHVVWFGEAVPMITEASKATEEADVFIIAGTSLNVYPAAGLISFLRTGTPVYVIDKEIPVVAPEWNIIPIRQNATTGVEQLIRLLQNGDYE